MPCDLVLLRWMILRFGYALVSLVPLPYGFLQFLQEAFRFVRESLPERGIPQSAPLLLLPLYHPLSSLLFVVEPPRA